MKNIQTEIKWAILFVVMTLIWMMIERLTGLHDIHIDKHPIYSNLIAIPAIAIYVFALLDKKKNFYNDKMTYKQGFISGLIITAIVAIISPITQYISLTLITPHFFENAIQYAISKNMMTAEEANNEFNLKNYIVVGFIGSVVIGIITAAIVAIFTKSKNEN